MQWHSLSFQTGRNNLSQRLPHRLPCRGSWFYDVQWRHCHIRWCSCTARWCSRAQCGYPSHYCQRPILSGFRGDCHVRLLLDLVHRQGATETPMPGKRVRVSRGVDKDDTPSHQKALGMGGENARVLFLRGPRLRRGLFRRRRVGDHPVAGAHDRRRERDFDAGAVVLLLRGVEGERGVGPIPARFRDRENPQRPLLVRDQQPLRAMLSGGFSSKSRLGKR
jgi:hypothetical protein